MTKRDPKESHCTVHGSDLRCLHCGDAYTMGVPASLTMVVAMMKQFETDHRKCKPSERGAARFKYTTPAEWLASWDTGESSKFIWHYMMGLAHKSSLPQDPADFGRCHRLLAAFPQWKARLPEMAEACRAWAPLIKAWPELERLYLEELPSGKCPKLFAAMAEYR